MAMPASSPWGQWRDVRRGSGTRACQLAGGCVVMFARDGIRRHGSAIGILEHRYSKGIEAERHGGHQSPCVRPGSTVVYPRRESGKAARAAVEPSFSPGDVNSAAVEAETQRPFNSRASHVTAASDFSAAYPLPLIWSVRLVS